MKSPMLKALATGIVVLSSALPAVAGPFDPAIPVIPERDVPLRPGTGAEPAPEAEPVPEDPGRRDRADLGEFGAGALLGLGAAILLRAGDARPARSDAHCGADWHTYCAATYPDYDPVTGTYRDRDGRRYACC